MNKIITNWKLVGALLVVFVSGILCGSLGTLAVLKKKIQQSRESTYLSELWMKRLESKLDLSGQQTAAHLAIHAPNFAAPARNRVQSGHAHVRDQGLLGGIHLSKPLMRR